MALYVEDSDLFDFVLLLREIIEVCLEIDGLIYIRGEEPLEEKGSRYNPFLLSQLD